MNSIIGFDLLKMQMVRKCRSFYCCLVAIYYIETVLKNFGGLRHKGPPVYTFHQVFYKRFVVLVF